MALDKYPFLKEILLEYYEIQDMDEEYLLFFTVNEYSITDLSKEALAELDDLIKDVEINAPNVPEIHLGKAKLSYLAKNSELLYNNLLKYYETCESYEPLDITSKFSVLLDLVDLSVAANKLENTSGHINEFYSQFIQKITLDCGFEFYPQEPNGEFPGRDEYKIRLASLELDFKKIRETEKEKTVFDAYLLFEKNKERYSKELWKGKIPNFHLYD